MLYRDVLDSDASYALIKRRVYVGTGQYEKQDRVRIYVSLEQVLYSSDTGIRFAWKDAEGPLHLYADVQRTREGGGRAREREKARERDGED